MNKCKKCGKMVREESSFCENCGQKQTPEGKKRKSKKGFIFSGLALILLLIGGFTYSSYENKVEENKISEAKASVASLFDSKNAINEKIAEKDILRADIKVDRLKNSRIKNTLNDDIKMASKMATIDDQLSVLASNDTIIDEKEKIKELKSVKKELEGTKEYSLSFYNRYSDEYKVVQEQYEAQENLEEELNLAQVGDDDKVTRDMYDHLVSQNEKIKNPAVKENFTVLLDKMANRLEERESKEKDSELARLEEEASKQNESAAIVYGEEIENVSLNYSPDSFLGSWTVNNQIIIIEDVKFAMGTQNSDDGIFGEIIDQSFNSSNNTLTLSIVMRANEMDGTTEDSYMDLNFGIEEIDGDRYIENGGLYYIKNN